jgi:hypothetical protein
MIATIGPGKLTHIVLWQEHPQDGVGEPALLLVCYDDVISIRQAGQEILVSRTSVEDLVRALRKATRAQPV